ncbi:MAG: hypothetical protein WD008_03720 [Balneolaceae bacterium]
MSELNGPSGFMDDEEPEYWDEFQWEEFMRESDKRTDLYIQLLKKYMDDPDRNEKIAKEMGWENLSDDKHKDFDQEFLSGIDEEGEEWKRLTGFKETEFNSVENFPLYQKAFQYTIDAMDLIELRIKNVRDESIEAFAKSIIIPPAKIAGGFGMGFEMDSLGGNIANCKRGLTAANRMLSALQEMRDKEFLDRETFLDFYSRGKEIRDGLAIYIVELREKFRRGIP